MGDDNHRVGCCFGQCAQHFLRGCLDRLWPSLKTLIMFIRLSELHFLCIGDFEWDYQGDCNITPFHFFWEVVTQVSSLVRTFKDKLAQEVVDLLSERIMVIIDHVNVGLCNLIVKSNGLVFWMDNFELRLMTKFSSRVLKLVDWMKSYIAYVLQLRHNR